MALELYSLNLSGDQVEVLYDAVAESLGLKRLYDEDDFEIANLEAILDRLVEMKLTVMVNKANNALIRKAQDGK